MGNQLIGRPVSQRSSFPTLGTPSSALSPDLSQFAGFVTPPQAPAQSANPAQLSVPNVPSILGFGGYRGGMGGGFGSFMNARRIAQPLPDR